MVNHKDNTNSYMFYILKCKVPALNKRQNSHISAQQKYIVPSKSIPRFLAV